MSKYDTNWLRLALVKRVTDLFAVAVFAVAPTFAIAENYPTAAEFASAAKVGKVYSCLHPNGTALFFQIGKITPFSAGKKAYHIQITPVTENDFALMHAPFMAESFTYCRPDPEARELGFVRFDRRAFRGGFKEWKQAKGGVYTIDVTEIFALVRQVLQ